MMETTKVTRFKDQDILLTQEGGNYFISFGNTAQTYWIEALDKIVKQKPDYKFTVETPIGEMDVTSEEIKPLVEQVKSFIEVCL